MKEKTWIGITETIINTEKRHGNTSAKVALPFEYSIRKGVLDYLREEGYEISFIPWLPVVFEIRWKPSQP